MDRNNFRRNPFGSKSTLEDDMDRTITELLSKAVARKATRIIKTVDEETKEEYEVKMDSGEPIIVKTIQSTKRECAICGRKVTQIFECKAPGCGALVCGKHKRTSASFTGGYKTICLSCNESVLEEIKIDAEAMERSHRHSINMNR